MKINWKGMAILVRFSKFWLTFMASFFAPASSHFISMVIAWKPLTLKLKVITVKHSDKKL